MKAKGIAAILAAAICAVAFWTAPIQATIVTIEIEAVVDDVRDPYNFLEGKVQLGDVITGWYIYDTSTPDSSAQQDYGAYWHYSPPAGIYLAVGGLEFRTDPDYVDYRIAISNGYHSRDTYSLRSRNNLPLPNGTLVDDVYWLLEDSTETAVSTDALPTAPPVLDDWEFNRLIITGPPRGGFGIECHVTSAIPEPATIFMFVLGGLFLKKQN